MTTKDSPYVVGDHISFTDVLTGINVTGEVVAVVPDGVALDGSQTAYSVLLDADSQAALHVSHMGITHTVVTGYAEKAEPAPDGVVTAAPAEAPAAAEAAVSDTPAAAPSTEEPPF